VCYSACLVRYRGNPAILKKKVSLYSVFCFGFFSLNLMSGRKGLLPAETQQCLRHSNYLTRECYGCSHSSHDYYYTRLVERPQPQPFYCPFLQDHLGEPVPEQNFWTLLCKGRLTESDTLTIRLSATPSGLSSAHLHHHPIFYRPDALPAAQPTVSKH